MRSHNKRQLDPLLNFLWFDKQSFKIKASYNKKKEIPRAIIILYCCLNVKQRNS